LGQKPLEATLSHHSCSIMAFTQHVSQRFYQHSHQLCPF
jgi:hypothetical protein